LAQPDYCIVAREGAPPLALYWKPQQGAVAVLVFVHGFGEHAGRYAQVYEAFPDCHCLGFDLRGHGHSGGARGHVRRFEDYRSDLAWVLREAQRRAPGLPVFLVGHSFGGLIATEAALHLDVPLAGLVLSSPAFALRLAPPAWERAMARVMNHLCPGLTRPARLRVDKLSHDPSVAEQVRQDPLSLGVASVRWYMECLDAQRRVLAAGADLELPVLCLVAGDDALVVPGVTEAFFESVASLDKTLKIFPDAYHELFQELDKSAVLGRVWRWCETRLMG